MSEFPLNLPMSVRQMPSLMQCLTKNCLRRTPPHPPPKGVGAVDNTVVSSCSCFLGFTKQACAANQPVQQCTLQESNATILLDEVERWVTGGAWFYVTLRFVKVGCCSSHEETRRLYKAKRQKEMDQKRIKAISLLIIFQSKFHDCISSYV